MAVTSRRSFRRGRLSAQLVDELERMIVEEYPLPNLHLPNETELGGRFGVSRIVVREAMKILEDRGLVAVRAGRGTLTTAPSPEKVKEALLRLFKDQPVPSLMEMEAMLELRQTLEEAAAELAAVRATPEDLREMEQALGEMGGGGPEDQIVQADLRFHRALATAAHNRYFEIVIGPLTQVFVQQIKLTNSYELGLDLHRNIFTAVQAGNQVAARQAVRRAMRATRTHTKIALNLLPQA